MSWSEASAKETEMCARRDLVLFCSVLCTFMQLCGVSKVCKWKQRFFQSIGRLFSSVLMWTREEEELEETCQGWFFRVYSHGVSVPLLLKINRLGIVPLTQLQFRFTVMKHPSLWSSWNLPAFRPMKRLQIKPHLFSSTNFFKQICFKISTIKSRV